MYSASLTPPLPPSLTSQHQQEQHHHSVYVQHIRFTLYIEYAISCGHIKSIMLSLTLEKQQTRADEDITALLYINIFMLATEERSARDSVLAETSPKPGEKLENITRRTPFHTKPSGLVSILTL
uniref:Uncharacterized protein n=1 Tax=Glossina austeni TaxID=7395 RepID=A0A1A9UGX6_GLOAU